MGRTKRIRRNRKNNVIIKYINTDVSTIEFIKWMSKYDWIDISRLRIAEFSNTGRGVLSLKKIKQNDMLIEVPLHLMITYKTLSESQLLQFYLKNSTALSIHEILSIYLTIEHHKGETSDWYKYLTYLPTLENILLPWFCSEEELLNLPQEIRNCVEDSIQNLEDSWNRISEIFISKSCQHCTQNMKEIFNRNAYNWAYTIVNTRAVYIDPIEIKKMSNASLDKILSDDPTMALCPYIDMFNHTSLAEVKAVLKPDGNVPKYCLITENNFNPYEEIFISYGAHDNKKLLCQYGFILPDNQFDSIEFTLRDIISVCKLKTTNKQYKFLCEHGFSSDISVNSIKFSFNMAAVLYVLSHENEIDWSMRVYTSTFNKEQLKLMYSLAEILLKWKLKVYEDELLDITSKVFTYSRHFEICLDYLKFRISLVRKIIDVK